MRVSSVKDSDSGIIISRPVDIFFGFIRRAHAYNYFYAFARDKA